MNSDLLKIKRNGASGGGSEHWLLQRLSGLFLALITVWLVIFCHDIASRSDVGGVISVIQKPYNTVLFSLFIVSAFYHSYLGMQVVIEDYVGCRALRLGAIIFLQFFSIVTVGAFIIAMFRIMTL